LKRNSNLNVRCLPLQNLGSPSPKVNFPEALDVDFKCVAWVVN
jgi:hypothetical protein